MNDTSKPASCEHVQLDVLLFGAEDSAVYRESAGHVDSCRLCQDRLTQLAADKDDWANVQTMLRRDPSVENLTDGSSGANPNGSSRRIKLDFLESPSPPEMLGRLGRYDIEQTIGAGGMGIVLKGFDTELNRPVAIKVLAPHLAHNGAARQRFAREARAAASIVHKHVVAIHDVNSAHVAPYLVMQFVAGQSLQERVDQDGPLTPEEILRIGMQAAAGLAAAHQQGVIHRDVKPANILLENGMERAMLTDFGLARAADDATVTHSGIITGTPHYMSPEQARGGASDARSDLFSLGAVLYFMATGHPPFRAERAIAVLHRICHDVHRPAQQVNSAIPADLADAIDRLLEKKPGHRFASADEVQQTLARVLAGLRQPSASRTRRWLRSIGRRRVRSLAAAGVLSVVLCAGGFVAWRTRTTDSQNASAHPAQQAVPEMNQTVGPVANENALHLQADVQALTASGARLAAEASAIRQQITRMESSSMSQSFSARSSAALWPGELNAVDAELTKLERSWSERPSVGPSSPRKGDQQ